MAQFGIEQILVLDVKGTGYLLTVRLGSGIASNRCSRYKVPNVRSFPSRLLALSMGFSEIWGTW